MMSFTPSGNRAPIAATLTGLSMGFTGMAWWAYHVVPLSLFGPTMLLGGCLLALAWYDATAFRLPDLLTLPLTALGLITGSAISGAPLDHILGAIAGFGICWLTAALHRRWRGVDGLGMGDAKLCAAGGAWLGLNAVPGFILLACLGAALWLATLCILRGKTALAQPLPLGIPLAAAIWVSWLYGSL